MSCVFGVRLFVRGVGVAGTTLKRKGPLWGPGRVGWGARPCELDVLMEMIGILVIPYNLVTGPRRFAPLCPTCRRSSFGMTLRYSEPTEEFTCTLCFQGMRIAWHPPCHHEHVLCYDCADAYIQHEATQWILRSWFARDQLWRRIQDFAPLRWTGVLTSAFTDACLRMRHPLPNAPILPMPLEPGDDDGEPEPETLLFGPVFDI